MSWDISYFHDIEITVGSALILELVPESEVGLADDLALSRDIVSNDPRKVKAKQTTKHNHMPSCLYRYFRAGTDRNETYTGIKQ